MSDFDFDKRIGDNTKKASENFTTPSDLTYDKRIEGSSDYNFPLKDKEGGSNYSFPVKK